MSVLVVTGITGSLGKAILKEQDFLISKGITKIRGLSRDEQKQVSLARDYTGVIPLKLFLADVSDYERMRFGMKDASYVIHAAAQKHVDKFELDVETGYKNNILGTQNVSKAFLESRSAKAGLFVSTDKAANPITSYGVSKLAAEHIWRWHNVYQKEVHMGVARFGNQYGSKGSVIETWTEKAKRGEEFLLTDIACTRFFMSIQDAARFVLHGLFDDTKALHLPKMKSIDMFSLGRVIWSYWNGNKSYHVKVVGMRSIEKVHEILEEGGVSSEHAERFSEAELKSLYEDWLGSLPSTAY